MTSVAITRALPVAAVAVAAGLVLWMGGRAPNETPLYSPDSAQPAATEAAARDADASAADSRTVSPAEKLRELNEMSETFRNTTFLIAIRDSGFVCRELLGVYGGVNDSMTWTATCSELLAYTVRVASTGNLHVEPMLEHSDSVTPTVQQDFGNDPVRVLPPRQLQPEPR
jgi:hypothetical protein